MNFPRWRCDRRTLQTPMHATIVSPDSAVGEDSHRKREEQLSPRRPGGPPSAIESCCWRPLRLQAEMLHCASFILLVPCKIFQSNEFKVQSFTLKYVILYSLLCRSCDSNIPLSELSEVACPPNRRLTELGWGSSDWQRRCGNSMISQKFYAPYGPNKDTFCAARQKLNQGLPAPCVLRLAAPQHKRYRRKEPSYIFISTMTPSSKG
jgi:hypothetical protein